MTLAEAIAAAVEADPSGDPYFLAGQVLSKVTKADLLDLVAEEVKHAQRSAARRAERQAFRSMVDRKPRPVPAMPEDSPLRALFATGVSMGDGSRVEWGTMTVEQHEARIAMLAKMRGGIDSTIAQHTEAIRLITEAGVSCLAELPGQMPDAPPEDVPLAA